MEAEADDIVKGAWRAGEEEGAGGSAVDRLAEAVRVVGRDVDTEVAGADILELAMAKGSTLSWLSYFKEGPPLDPSDASPSPKFSKMITAASACSNVDENGIKLTTAIVITFLQSNYELLTKLEACSNFPWWITESAAKPKLYIEVI
ncbi:hypothetical protein GUJ93_ZPchr0012g19024 [Zizania palustris]|uniref:Uncharacterized protein n=1 Tax=Zizania palustris TaxID=103762 RepID=A0A8J5WII3_ZIZPA|nr:hypothetical protein GUJ93_ZPchr0012g19024 [Zizania palustris]